jgi:hypothetical protein
MAEKVSAIVSRSPSPWPAPGGRFCAILIRQLDGTCADILAPMPTNLTSSTDLARRSRRGRDWQTLAASMSYDHRTRIGTLARGLHDELLEDAGPDISAARRLAISCLTFATVSLFQVQREADGVMTPENGEMARQWLTTCQKFLALIGLERVTKPAIDLHDYLATLSGDPPAPEPKAKPGKPAKATKKAASDRGPVEVGSPPSRPEASRPVTPAAHRRTGPPSAPPGPPVLTVVPGEPEDVGAL